MATELVDASKLDACCTAEANAIRAKTGSSAQIVYDWANSKGFADAIAAISGEEDPNENLIKLAKNILTSVDIDMSNARVKERLFNSATALITARIRNMGANSGQYIFYLCSNLETAVLSGSGAIPSHTFNSCAKLTAVDIDGMTLQNGSVFTNASLLTAVIIRNDTVAALGNIIVFNNTPFASSGTGGTLYVPASLISSYQSATNWSTILSYPNNQIKSIESTHTDPTAPIDLTLYYADGTPIS